MTIRYRIVAGGEAPVWRALTKFEPVSQEYKDLEYEEPTVIAVYDLPDEVAMPLLREPGFYDSMVPA